jgi:eukaryotic-like serine/threonine-protein kinase
MDIMTESTQQKAQGIRWWNTQWFTLSISAFLAGGIFLAIGDWIVMPLITRGTSHIVPELYGEDVAIAKRMLRENDLVFISDSSDYIWDKEVPANHIASQDPPPYTVVKKGRRVRVVLSRGPQLYPVPDVRNTSTTQARLRIEQQGFRLGNVAFQLRTNDDHSDAYVLTQFPGPGTQQPRGTTVDFTVSVIATMPDLTGRGHHDAAGLLGKLGLTIGSTVYEMNEFLLPRSVVSQSIQPGSRIQHGDKVNLVLSHL